MPIYMKYDSIPGDVTAEGHASWIELNSLQWGVNRFIKTDTGSASDRESSAPTVLEVSITKAMDIATPKILQQALQGKGVEVTIHLCKTDQNELQMYAEYILSNTLISSFSTNTSGDRPFESLSLNFTKVQYRNVSVGASDDDADDKPESIYYDTAKAKGK
jgi:type VI secretion system secreted protein Hcp